VTAARNDLGISAVVTAFALLVWWGTVQIDTEAGLFEGPRLLPSIVGTGLLMLSAGLAAHAAWRIATGAPSGGPPEPVDWRGFARVAAPLLVLLFSYVALLIGFGYLLATVLAAPAAFLLFGNRGPLQVLVLPIMLAVLFYVLFFHLLGMFDPPGTVLDISQSFR
jgi:hypothetical protein